MFVITPLSAEGFWQTEALRAQLQRCGDASRRNEVDTSSLPIADWRQADAILGQWGQVRACEHKMVAYLTASKTISDVITPLQLLTVNLGSAYASENNQVCLAAVSEINAQIRDRAAELRARSAKTSACDDALPQHLGRLSSFHPTHVVTAQSGLILRAQPHYESRRIGGVPYNTAVILQQRVGDWARVVLPPGLGLSEGWVSLRYLYPLTDQSRVSEPVRAVSAPGTAIAPGIPLNAATVSPGSCTLATVRERGNALVTVANESGVKVYASASTNTDPLGQLPYRAVATYHGEAADTDGNIWIQVMFPGEVLANNQWRGQAINSNQIYSGYVPFCRTQDQRGYLRFSASNE